MLKLEFQRDGSYRIRAYSEKAWFRYVHQQTPHYLTLDNDYRRCDERVAFETYSYNNAVQRLYAERRKAILGMVAAIRKKQDDKVRAEAVAYQNKRLKNV
jgi:hypothetical protein